MDDAQEGSVPGDSPIVPATTPGDQQTPPSHERPVRPKNELQSFVLARRTVDDFKTTDLTADMRNWLHWIYTNNPFYVISAAFVLYGLRISFGAGGTALHTLALMFGLTGYTVLLAVAAWFLIRFGKLWEDVRTLLLLVVLLFLAISVSFDETVVTVAEKPQAHVPLLFYGGLAFAIVLSELLLRGIGLRLPAGFRLPFHAIMAAFFLYPVGLIQWIHDPAAPSINWGLFCFSPVMACVSLTLLPAIRRGPEYVSNNGSPWRWPWYPWILFGVLAFGVCARAYYLCYSFHGTGEPGSIFGLYFLVPFLFVANILLLEVGLVSRHKQVIGLALLLPAGLVALAMTASPADAGDLGFLALFDGTLHFSPLFLTLSAVTVFYFVALVRQVPYAWLALSLTLIVSSCCGPGTFNPKTPADPIGLPILAAGGLFFLAGLMRRHALGCLLGGWCAVAAVSIDFRESSFTAYHGAIPLHLLLASLLVVGAVFRNAWGKWIQNLGAAAMLLLALAAANFSYRGYGDLPHELLAFYPPAVAVGAVAYGLLVKNRWFYGSALGSVCGWSVGTGWSGYRQARNAVVGLNYIVLGGLFFLIAIVVSLSKMGLLQRLFSRGRKRE